ncbi:hypothetical protein B0H21DRAFT_754878 [Amylocystis lapponica]|nr:hypothetical protein B0H21DRAFT_754878 [Amylocystis lapponica]
MKTRAGVIACSGRWPSLPSLLQPSINLNVTMNRRDQSSSRVIWVRCELCNAAIASNEIFTHKFGHMSAFRSMLDTLECPCSSDDYPCNFASTSLEGLFQHLQTRHPLIESDVDYGYRNSSDQDRDKSDEEGDGHNNGAGFYEQGRAAFTPSDSQRAESPFDTRFLPDNYTTTSGPPQTPYTPDEARQTTPEIVYIMAGNHNAGVDRDTNMKGSDSDSDGSAKGSPTRGDTSMESNNSDKDGNPPAPISEVDEFVRETVDYQERERARRRHVSAHIRDSFSPDSSLEYGRDEGVAPGMALVSVGDERLRFILTSGGSLYPVSNVHTESAFP